MNKIFLLILTILICCASCKFDTPSEGTKPTIKERRIMGKYIVDMKVKTSSVSGNEGDTGMSQISNAEMWMEFFTSGKILNSTLISGEMTKSEGDWHMEKDSLFFTNESGLTYSYLVENLPNRIISLKNDTYELTLTPE